MSIFQCQKCHCAENTALGWYHSRNSKRLNTPETQGKALCSACAPLTYPNEEKTRFTGQWHNKFARTYLPAGSCFTNGVGNLEHKESGLVGSDLYAKYGSDKPFPLEEDSEVSDGNEREH